MSAMILPQVSCKYGAPMGRSWNVTEMDFPVKFRLRRLRWVDGDYDQGGAYWGGGRGDHIYWARGDGEDATQEMFVRATCRDDAKEQVRNVFRNATFFN